MFWLEGCYFDVVGCLGANHVLTGRGFGTLCPQQGYFYPFRVLRTSYNIIRKVLSRLQKWRTLCTCMAFLVVRSKVLEVNVSGWLKRRPLFETVLVFKTRNNSNNIEDTSSTSFFFFFFHFFSFHNDISGVGKTAVIKTAWEEIIGIWNFRHILF